MYNEDCKMIWSFEPNQKAIQNVCFRINDVRITEDWWKKDGRNTSKMLHQLIPDAIQLPMNSVFEIRHGKDKYKFRLVKCYLSDTELKDEWMDDSASSCRRYCQRCSGERPQRFIEYVKLFMNML